MENQKRDMNWWFYAIPEYFFSNSRLGGMLRFIVLLILMLGWFLIWFAIQLNLRFLVAPMFGLIGAYVISAVYVQDVYELVNTGSGLQYLFASIFGIGLPSVDVVDGRLALEEDEENLIEKIGGPGFVTVRPGNAVVFESWSGPVDVKGNGIHPIDRFIKIKEIADLKDHVHQREELNAVTKDRIKVVVRNIEFHYRLWIPQKEVPFGRSIEKPYPYSKQAIRNMAYERIVSEDGLRNWHDMVQGMVFGKVIGYIRKSQVGKIMSINETDQDPRDEIRKIMGSAATRELLFNVGAQLLWFDVGHFEFEDQRLEKKRQKLWKEQQSSQAFMLRLEGMAQRLAAKEHGRSEAQREILQNIMDMLDEFSTTGKGMEQRKKVFRNIIMAKFSKLIDRRTSTLLSLSDFSVNQDDPEED